MNEKDNIMIWELKAISCIIVILFHCPIQGIIGDAIIYAVRFPIPIFFMISGYYSFGKMNYLRYARKTLHLIVIGELISFIAMNICYFCGISTVNPYQTLKSINWLKTFFFGAIFNSTLWYLYAVFWGWILLYFLAKSSYGMQLLKWCIVPALIFHIVGRALVIKYGNIDQQVFLFRSTMLYAIPFLGIGRLIAEYKEEIIKRSFRVVPQVLFVIGIILLVVEYIIWHQYMDLHVSTIFISMSLFLFAVRNPDFLSINPVVYIGHISQYIYLFHIPVLMVLKNIVETYFMKMTKILPGGGNCHNDSGIRDICMRC